MIRGLFFKTTLISFLVFWGFTFLVFSCGYCLKKRLAPKLNPDLSSREDKGELNNIGLEDELKKRQQAGEDLSQTSKETQDAAKERIRNIRE